MITSHYVKSTPIAPDNMNETEKLVHMVLQMDCLMDLEYIYSEIRYICMDRKTEMPSFNDVKTALKSLITKNVAYEFTDDDINYLIIMKKNKAQAQQETNNKYLYGNWTL